MVMMVMIIDKTIGYGIDYIITIVILLNIIGYYHYHIGY